MLAKSVAFVLGLLSLALVAPAVASAQAGGKVEGRLKSEIIRIAAESKGTVGVAAIHLPSGARVEHNAGQPFPMASALKLPLAVYALHLGERGRIPLDRALPVSRQQLIEPGVLFDHFPFPGLALSTLNAVNLSLSVSDNGATDIVYARVGGPRAVNDWMKAIGISGIDMGTKTVSETFAAADDAPAEPLARTATPAAMAELLARLHQGKLVGAEPTKTLLDIMERTQGERLSLQLPPGAKVRHKTGTLFSAAGLSVNDVGLVELPNGETIAIAVFIKDSPETVAHATRDKVIGGIARAIHDYFLFRE